MDFKSAIIKYCDYQERCHKEVRNKLYELGAKSYEVQQLISELIETDLLNEERYAKAFARGKFRIKYWGKKKIAQELKNNQVSEYCIKKALLEIDSEEYDTVIRKLAEKRHKLLTKEANLFVKKQKIVQFLLQKGYEYDIILDTVQTLLSTETNC